MDLLLQTGQEFSHIGSADSNTDVRDIRRSAFRSGISLKSFSALRSPVCSEHAKGRQTLIDQVRYRFIYGVSVTPNQLCHLPIL